MAVLSASRTPCLTRTELFFENATVRGRAWYKRLDAPVLTLDVTWVHLTVESSEAMAVLSASRTPCLTDAKIADDTNAVLGRR